MDILVLSHEYPSPQTGGALRIFNFLKYLSKKYGHDITLISLIEKTEEPRYVYKLNEYCSLVETIDMPELGVSFFRTIGYVIKNMFSFQYIFSKDHILSAYYSPIMQRKVREILRTKKFDIILVSSLPMAFYVLDVKLPKVVDAMDATSEALRQRYILERNFAMKIFWLVLYYEKIRYAKIVYKKGFNAWVAISSYDRKILQSYLPNLDISVIPNGIDTEYFSPRSIEEEFPSLIFVGDMRSPHNVDAVLYFSNKIYPLIKEKIPDIKLFIVGRHPPDKIYQLSSDESIVVTGYVKDIRPYLNKSSIVVVPMLSGTGIKNKILEAMAMEKPVISTSIGARGLDVKPDENIVIADHPMEFARRVIELLNDDKLRRKIARNGRKFVEIKYSWEKMAGKLNNILESATGEFK